MCPYPRRKCESVLKFDELGIAEDATMTASA